MIKLYVPTWMLETHKALVAQGKAGIQCGDPGAEIVGARWLPDDAVGFVEDGYLHLFRMHPEDIAAVRDASQAGVA